MHISELARRFMGNAPKVAPTGSVVNKNDPTLDDVISYAKTGDLHSLEQIFANHGDALWKLRDYDGKGILQHTTENGHTKCVDWMLSKGAKPRIMDDSGNAPIFTAITKNYVEIIELLVNYGKQEICTSIEHTNGDTPLLAALKHGRMKAVDSILNHCGSIEEINHMNNSGDYIGSICVKMNQFDLLKRLHKEKRVLLSRAGESGYTPLHYAMQAGSTEFVKFLLEAGVDPNVTTSFGKTALHIACERFSGSSHMKAIKSFLSKTAKSNTFITLHAKDTEGSLPHHHLLYKNETSDAIKTLDSFFERELHQNSTKYCATIYEKNRSGDSIWTLASSKPGFDKLVKRYADPNYQERAVEAKIQVCSDLHIEFGHPTAPLVCKRAPYLALLGDIGVVSNEQDQYKNFLLSMANTFDKVFVIPGNHEFYGSCYQDAYLKMQDICRSHPNLILMYKSTYKIPKTNIRILGTTLWTRIPEEAFGDVQKTLNDYKRITVREGEKVVLDTGQRRVNPGGRSRSADGSSGNRSNLKLSKENEVRLARVRSPDVGHDEERGRARNRRSMDGGTESPLRSLSKSRERDRFRRYRRGNDEFPQLDDSPKIPSLALPLIERLQFPKDPNLPDPLPSPIPTISGSGSRQTFQKIRKHLAPERDFRVAIQNAEITRKDSVSSEAEEKLPKQRAFLDQKEPEKPQALEKEKNEKEVKLHESDQAILRPIIEAETPPEDPVVQLKEIEENDEKEGIPKIRETSIEHKLERVESRKRIFSLSLDLFSSLKITKKDRMDSPMSSPNTLQSPKDSPKGEQQLGKKASISQPVTPEGNTPPFSPTAADHDQHQEAMTQSKTVELEESDKPKRGKGSGESLHRRTSSRDKMKMGRSTDKRVRRSRESSPTGHSPPRRCSSQRTSPSRTSPGRSRSRYSYGRDNSPRIRARKSPSQPTEEDVEQPRPEFRSRKSLPHLGSHMRDPSPTPKSRALTKPKSREPSPLRASRSKARSRESSPTSTSKLKTKSREPSPSKTTKKKRSPDASEGKTEKDNISKSKSKSREPSPTKELRASSNKSRSRSRRRTGSPQRELKRTTTAEEKEAEIQPQNSFSHVKLSKSGHFLPREPREKERGSDREKDPSPPTIGVRRIPEKPEVEPKKKRRMPPISRSKSYDSAHFIRIRKKVEEPDPPPTLFRAPPPSPPEEERGRTRTRSETSGSSARLITPLDTTNWHIEEANWLSNQISECKKNGETIVVFTHHSPVAGLGCGNSEKVSGLHIKHTSAYWTDLVGLMDGVTLWAYGHTHWFHDINFKGTRVVSNPHGYPPCQETIEVSTYVATPDKSPYSPYFVVSLP